MLHPAFLIASAITDEGWIDLPAAGEGTTMPIARAQFAPESTGGYAQRVIPGTATQGGWHPLDMAFFARCLALAFGSVTPDLFAVCGVGTVSASRGRLARLDTASKKARLRCLRSAFLLHSAAYKDRLV